MQHTTGSTPVVIHYLNLAMQITSIEGYWFCLAGMDVSAEGNDPLNLWNIVVDD